MAPAEPQALMLGGGQTRQVANSWLHLEFHMKPVPVSSSSLGALSQGAFSRVIVYNAM